MPIPTKIQNLSFFIIFLSGLSFSLSAQVALMEASNELDEDFLKSLPKELQEEIGQEDEGTKKEIDKLLNTKTSALKNKEALQLIKKQLESLENRMNVDITNDDVNQLKRFGLSFFNSIQSTFMPVNVPNFDSDYVLDVGDKITINLVGSKSKIYNDQIIERDGSISLKDFGKIYLAGQKFSQAQNIVEKFFLEKTVGNEVFITLTEVRDVQVIMLGSIENPGVYTISGGSNVLHALNVAGGIAKNGSYRSIKLLRSGKAIKTFDLYETMILGNPDIFNINLRSGDTILVDPVGFYVPISGGVNNEAIYDVKDGETVQDIISFAGGFSQDTYMVDKIFIERDNSFGREIIELNKTNLDQFILQPRDSVNVPKYVKEIKKIPQVTLSGAINRPGIYNLEEGETISSLIKRAGGYRDEAYVFGGMLYRKSVEEKSKAFGQRIYADTIAFLVSNLGKGGSGQSLTGDFLKILTEEFRSQESIARVISEFNIQKIESNQAADTMLEDNDVIDIPVLPQHVYLFGDFNQSVILPYNSDFSVNDYIELAAGKKSSATKHLIIVDPNGMSHYFEKPFFTTFSENRDIYPGTIIYLPRELGKVEGIMYASAIAPILSSLTLSLASVNAIRND